MRETRQGLSHAFLRLGFLIVSLIILVIPWGTAFAQFPGFPSVQVPGGGGGGGLSFPSSVTGGGGGGLNFGLPSADIGVYGGGNAGLGFPSSVTGGATIDPVTGAVTPGAGGGAGDPTVTETEGKVTMDSVQKASNANIDERAYGIMISLGGWIAGLGGILFETSFDHFVLGMGCYFTKDSNCPRITANGQIGGVVDQLWIIIRDLFNLALIFSLIFIGFKMIWNADDSGTRRALGYLILAALLVNFSLYLAKVVVDVANFSAVEIFEQMTKTTPTEGSTPFSIEKGAGAFSLGAGNRLAGMFMTVLAVPSWFQPSDGVANSWTFALMAFVFLFFLGAIFMYAAFMMMARFIAIVVLLIFSPLMFIGWVLPSFSGYSSKWRKMFVSYAFYAPVFVFMLYLSLYSLLSLSTILGADVKGGGYATAFAPDGTMAAGHMNIFVFFFVGAGFLFASTKVAGIMADAGAGASMNMASSFAKRISTGAAAVGGGYLANSAAGRIGRYLEKDADINESRTGRSDTLSRFQRKLGGKLKQTKIGGAPSFKDYRDEVEASDKKAGALKAQRDASLVLARAGTSPADIAAKERAIAGLSNADVIAMAKTSDGEKTLKANAHLLRPEQIKALREDKEVDESTKKTILGARETKVKDAVTTGTAVKDLNDDQLASLDVEFLKQEAIAVDLTEARIDKMAQLTASEKQVVKEERKKALVKVAGGNNLGSFTFDKLVNSKPEDLAKLPSEVFKIEAFSSKLSANAVKSRHFADLDKATQAEIKKHLVKLINNPPSTMSQADLDRIAEIDGYLRSPAGSSFGQ